MVDLINFFTLSRSLVETLQRFKNSAVIFDRES
jgi:hypothetical protein